MCGTCGCGDSGRLRTGLLRGAATPLPRLSVPQTRAASTRTLQLETDVLAANNRLAAHNRARFLERGLLALNVLSSPGSGKTTLLCGIIQRLRASSVHEVSVIEGDQHTARDAERIRALGVPAIQINTGQGCHLDAAMVAEAFQQLPGASSGFLFIENVGNLVCPALWDLGERAKLVVVSVTEGDDKPLKYPDMFAAATLLIVNKIDLLPYVSFDIAACVAYARRVQPALEVIQVSATRGDGMPELAAWLQQQAAALRGSSERERAHNETTP